MRSVFATAMSSHSFCSGTNSTPSACLLACSVASPMLQLPFCGGVDHGEARWEARRRTLRSSGGLASSDTSFVEQDARAAAPLPVRETHALIQQAAPRRDAKRIAFPYDKSHAALVQADDRHGRARARR